MQSRTEPVFFLLFDRDTRGRRSAAAPFRVVRVVRVLIFTVREPLRDFWPRQYLNVVHGLPGQERLACGQERLGWGQKPLAWRQDRFARWQGALGQAVRALPLPNGVSGAFRIDHRTGEAARDQELRPTSATGLFRRPLSFPYIIPSRIFSPCIIWLKDQRFRRHSGDRRRKAALAGEIDTGTIGVNTRWFERQPEQP